MNATGTSTVKGRAPMSAATIPFCAKAARPHTAKRQGGAFTIPFVAPVEPPRPLSRLELDFDTIDAMVVVQVWNRGESPYPGLVDSRHPGQEVTFTLARRGACHQPSSFSQDRA